MKISNYTTSFSAGSNLSSVQQNLVSRGTKRASLFGALLLLALLAAAVIPASAQTVFYNNTNTGGVLDGVANGYGTIVNLPQQAQPSQYVITQIQTYHWFDGHGDAGPGQISVWINTPNGRVAPRANNTFNVQVVPGAYGVPANWVATISPPLVLNPGSYIIDDSHYNTWSRNPGSAGCLYFAPSFQCGFVKVLGNLVALQSSVGSTPVSYRGAPTTTTSTPPSAPLVQTSTRPDLRNWGGCAPSPYLPTCNVNLSITPYTHPSTYDIISQTLEYPGTTAATLIQQSHVCARQGGTHMYVIKDAYYFYSSTTPYAPGNQWAVMACLK